ncbi:MAG: hypothetical protein KDD36_03500 [Flavobacteriales bacterium]|nr:hypothetical protein [Flavobacteriales bacterium]
MLRKNLLSIVLTTAITGSGFAQMNNVQTANNMLRSERYAEAKKAIDDAAANESTSNHVKMWYYRAKVYYDIHQKKSDLDPNAIEKAAEATMHCIDVDDKELYTKEMRQMLISSAGLINNKAIDKLNEGKSDEAEALWLSILKIVPYDNQKSLARSNLSDKNIYVNCYSAAMRADNNAKAKEYLQKLMDMNYNDPSIYLDMSNLFYKENNLEEALKYVEKGRALFESDKNLITQQVHLYVKMDRTDDLISKLNEELANDPEAANLLYLRGKLLEKKDDKAAEAEADLKKAAELDPGNADYWIDLGIAQYNAAGTLIETANAIKDLKKYEAAKAKADAKFKEAAGSFERVQGMQPENTEVLDLLKKVYIRTKEDDKYNAVKAKLEELQNK